MVLNHILSFYVNVTKSRYKEEWRRTYELTKTSAAFLIYLVNDTVMPSITGMHSFVFICCFNGIFNVRITLFRYFSKQIFLNYYRACWQVIKNPFFLFKNTTLTIIYIVKKHSLGLREAEPLTHMTLSGFPLIFRTYFSEDTRLIHLRSLQLVLLGVQIALLQFCNDSLVSNKQMKCLM